MHTSVILQALRSISKNPFDKLKKKLTHLKKENYWKYDWQWFYASGQVMHLFPLSFMFAISDFMITWNDKRQKINPLDQVTFFFEKFLSQKKKKHDSLH